MTEIPRWAMALPSNAKKAELAEMADQAAASGFRGRPLQGATKAVLTAWLIECKREFWAKRAPKRDPAPRRPAPASSLCEIPAAEVNAWLRTLPQA